MCLININNNKKVQQRRAGEELGGGCRACTRDDHRNQGREDNRRSQGGDWRETVAETSEELAVGRARAEFPARIQGHKPTAESREGGRGGDLADGTRGTSD